jgi:glycosyl hydrolase family 26
MLHLAIDNAPAILWGFYSDQDWQRSNNGLAAYAAIDKMIGKAQTATCPQLSWAWGVNPDGTPQYQRLYTPRLEADRAAGRLSVLTWMSFNLSHPEQNALFNNETILAGKHDAYLAQFAQDCAAYGHKFVVRFDPEMNGWWEGPFSEYDNTGKLANGNTDGSFVRAWRYVVDKVRPVAPNVLWYWCANPVTSGSTTQPTHASRLAHFYPGDSYADFVGYDIYNKAAVDGATWLSFRECLEGRPSGWPANSLAALVAIAPGKPWILGEVGCAGATAGDTTPGAGDRAAWIRDALDTIRTRYPFVRALLWFNVAPYAIDAATAVGFTQGTANDSYPGAPLPDPESVGYRLVGMPDIPAVQAQLAQARADLAKTQADLAAAQADAQAGRRRITDLLAWASPRT